MEKMCSSNFIIKRTFSGSFEKIPHKEIFALSLSRSLSVITCQNLKCRLEKRNLPLARYANYEDLLVPAFVLQQR